MTTIVREYLTVTDVSRLTGYDEKTVYRALRTGRLKGTKPATSWRTTRQDVATWMEGPK